MDGILRKFYGGGDFINPGFGVYIEDYSNNKSKIKSPFQQRPDSQPHLMNANYLKTQATELNYDRFLKNLNSNNINGNNDVPKKFHFDDEYNAIPKIRTPNYRHGPQEAAKIQMLELKLLHMEKQHNEDKQNLLDIINNNILNIRPQSIKTNQNNNPYQNNKTRDDLYRELIRDPKGDFDPDKNAIQGLNVDESKIAMREIKYLKENLVKLVENEEERGYLKRKEFEADMKLMYSELISKVDRLEQNRQMQSESIKYILENSGSNRVKSMSKRLFGSYVPNLSNAPREIVDKKIIVKRESQINEDSDEYRENKKDNKKVRFSSDNENEINNFNNRHSSSRIGRDNTFRSMESNNQTDSNEDD